MLNNSKQNKKHNYSSKVYALIIGTFIICLMNITNLKAEIDTTITPCTDKDFFGNTKEIPVLYVDGDKALLTLNGEYKERPYSGWLKSLIPYMNRNLIVVSLVALEEQDKIISPLFYEGSYFLNNSEKGFPCEHSHYYYSDYYYKDHKCNLKENVPFNGIVFSSTGSTCQELYFKDGLPHTKKTYDRDQENSKITLRREESFRDNIEKVYFPSGELSYIHKILPEKNYRMMAKGYFPYQVIQEYSKDGKLVEDYNLSYSDGLYEVKCCENFIFFNSDGYSAEDEVKADYKNKNMKYIEKADLSILMNTILKDPDTCSLPENNNKKSFAEKIKGFFSSKTKECYTEDLEIQTEDALYRDDSKEIIDALEKSVLPLDRDLLLFSKNLFAYEYSEQQERVSKVYDENCVKNASNLKQLEFMNCAQSADKLSGYAQALYFNQNCWQGTHANYEENLKECITETNVKNETVGVNLQRIIVKNNMGEIMFIIPFDTTQPDFNDIPYSRIVGVLYEKYGPATSSASVHVGGKKGKRIEIFDWIDEEWMMRVSVILDNSADKDKFFMDLSNAKVLNISTIYKNLKASKEQETYIMNKLKEEMLQKIKIKMQKEDEERKAKEDKIKNFSL